MFITVYTTDNWYVFELDTHDIQVVDEVLWVFKDTANASTDDTVAVFASGEWKRIEFDRV